LLGRCRVAPRWRYIRRTEKRFIEAARNLKVGYGLDEDTQMRPLYSRKHLENVLGYVDKGLEEGAEIVLDGRKVKVDAGAV
jgi:malonate-semialdehyde dehydrogenase (acetylating)/methylmalonate-semialdehyde dehydrogenase